MPNENNSAYRDEKDLVEKKEQMKILLDQVNVSFDRFLLTVNNINSKILSLFEIYIVLVTLQISIMVYFIDVKKISTPFILLLGFGLFIIIMTIMNFLHLTFPKSYEHIDMFEKNRFEELCESNRYDLLSDFLYNTQESYQNNDKNYKELIKGLNKSIWLVMATFFYFIIILYIYFFIFS